MTWEQIAGFVRHVLTFGGGFLVTAGYMTNTDMELGVGAIATLIGLGWSYAVKRKAK